MNLTLKDIISILAYHCWPKNHKPTPENQSHLHTCPYHPQTQNFTKALIAHNPQAAIFLVYFSWTCWSFWVCFFTSSTFSLSRAFALSLASSNCSMAFVYRLSSRREAAPSCTWAFALRCISCVAVPAGVCAEPFRALNFLGAGCLGVAPEGSGGSAADGAVDGIGGICC